MKKLISLAAVALLFAACSQKPVDPNAFTLNGTINAYEGEEVCLYYGTPGNETNDTAVVKDGKFQFKGSIEKPTYIIVYKGDLKDYQNVKYTRFWINPGQLTVAIDTANWEQVVVTGSPSNDEQNEMDAIHKEFAEQLNTLYEQKKAAQEADDQQGYMAIDEQIESINKNIEDCIVEFMKSHPNSYPAAQYMTFIVGNKGYEENKALYDEVKAEITALENVRPGHEAPELEGPNLFGKDSIRLSDYRGKVVLVDFWASWCVPCRASMPHVLALYKKYHTKGFEVFCVADNDSNPEEAVKAAKKDGTTAFLHTLRGLQVFTDADGKFQGYDKSKDISERYCVHYLPTKYLIDREGRIVAKIETDEQLDAELAKLFK